MLGDVHFYITLFFSSYHFTCATDDNSFSYGVEADTGVSGNSSRIT